MPSGELELQQPPDLPEAQAAGGRRLAMLVPSALMAGGMVMLYLPGAGRGGGSAGLFGMLLMGGGMAGMAATQLLGNSGDRAAQATGDRRDYLRFLSQARRRIRRSAEQQRAAAAWVHPDPASLWSLAMTTRMWERRPAHPDFGEVRLGTGPQRLAVRVAVPQTKPVEDLDPISAKALRRFVHAYTTLNDQPIPLFLRGFATIRLDGEREQVLGLLRAALAQLVTFHGPDDLRVAVCAGAATRPDWDWVKWLPHCHHTGDHDATGRVRLVASGGDELDRLLGEDLSARARFDPAATPSRGEPYLVVVNDEGRLSPHHRLAGMGYRNVLLIDLDGVGGRPEAPTLHLAVEDGAVHRVSVDRVGRPVRTRIAAPDRLGLPAVTALARLLSRHEIPGGVVEVQADEGLTVDRDLPSLLGLGDLDGFDPQQQWAARPASEELRVPIGTTADGSPLVLDIKESAQGGMGPHGLLIGATGSGKSELLRTLVLALTMTHSSQALNLVLVDFKGGATFAGLDGLSHVSAVITNLADEAALVGRMRDALHGELVRRQELLRAAGNFSSRRDYEQARRQGAELAPLPSLFVVVDEFSELISSHPDFIELFVMIGRLGRSLGVHLLLASQRLDEGRISQLEGHLSYRIGLRTFSASESRAVIGVGDAYELPSAPGNGYLRTDVSTIARFKAAYVSGAVRRRTRPERQEVIAAQVVPFGVDPVAVPAPPSGAPSGAGGGTDDPDGAAAGRAAGDGGGAGGTGADGTGADGTGADGTGADGTGADGTGADGTAGTAPSVLQVVTERLRGQGPPAHRVWLPPLDASPTLDQLLPPLLPDPEHGLRPAVREEGDRLVVPLGLIDKPFEQVRDLLLADLSGVGGHLGIAGGPRSGKSTLVRSVVCALALTRSPAEVQFLCLDFGGGSLATLTELPHVGGVTGRLDPDRVNRTVAELTALLADRESRFAELGLDGMTAYRAAGAVGRLAPGENTAEVFLVVDGYATLRQEFEAAEQAIRQVVQRGLNFGIHLVAAANRWADMHHAMRDQLGTKLELKLGDHVDSTIDMRMAAGVPAQPGRGLTTDKLHFLAALPRIDGIGAVEDLAEGTEALAEAVADCWNGPAAMGVRTLPTVLALEELPAAHGTRLALGIEESRLEPVWHDFADTPHLTVLGDSESGKTNLLRLVLRGLTAGLTPEQARILVVDWRRALFEEVPARQRLGYAVSADTTAAAVKDAVAGLRGRVPGPDITPEQLRRRDWWSGPDLFVVIDDFDLLAGHENPLHPLVDFLPQAADIGLHVVVARAAAGSMRSGSDLLLRRLQELNTPDIALSCPRDEGMLLGGTRPRTLPPGRAQLCTRRGSRLIQTGFAAVVEPVTG